MNESSIKRVYDFLNDVGTYYLATDDNGQPRVRPFGTVLLFENKIYILTAKSKNVSKQIENNAKFEISTINHQNEWIRLSGDLVEDNRREIHIAMLDKYPHLKNSYQVSDPNTNTLYLDNISASIYSFEKEPEELE